MPHLPVRGRDEVAAVTRAYNAMLDRLEAERIRTVRAALRKDFHKFPEFSGATDHFPFRTVWVRGEKHPEQAD